VKEKETLYAISKKYGVTIDDILKWNELEGTEVRKGQQLKIVR
jgi:LysM repeat protein